MTEPRIFVSPESVEGGVLHFSDDVLHHLRKVLRRRKGDLVRVTDGSGSEYLVSLVEDSGRLGGKIVEESRPRRESPLEIVLVQALPRKGLMETVLQKAVELGVAEIRPVVTARTVVAPRKEKEGRRHERWRRIVEGSVAQCGRTRVPRLGAVQRWADFLSEGSVADLKLLLKEGGGRGLGRALRSGIPPASAVVAVGPEGGWEEDEVVAALEHGFEVLGLGPRILRTGTAGLAALSVLQFLWGDLDLTRGGGADAEQGTMAL